MSKIRLAGRVSAGAVLVMAAVGAAGTTSWAEDVPPDRVLTFTATLSGAEEIDPTTLEPGAGDPDASGTATVKLIGATTACASITIEGVTLPAKGAQAAHIHQGPAGVNGPVVIPLPTPNSEGISVGCVEVAPELLAAIADNPGGYYVNVHTVDFPNGAARGQLLSGAECIFDPEQPPASATITASGLVRGTPGPDVIVAGDGPDTILGLGGDDIICGQGGDDTIIGGPGNDTLVGDDVNAGPPFGPGGNDTLVGGQGDDQLFGLGGDDTEFGGPGADLIIGFGGNDDLFGGGGADTIFAGPDDDHVVGGAGPDTIFGNFGSDTLLGGPGDDVIDGDNPNPPPSEPGGPTEQPGAADLCLGEGGTDQIFNCEAGDPSTPRTPPPPSPQP